LCGAIQLEIEYDHAARPAILPQVSLMILAFGYTPPEGSRKYFGALLVGYYAPEGLLFAGRVGTGFSERALETLYDGFQKIRRTMCPFVNLPGLGDGGGGSSALIDQSHFTKEPIGTRYLERLAANFKFYFARPNDIYCIPCFALGINRLTSSNRQRGHFSFENIWQFHTHENFC
jgi:hypothetical protein